VEQRRALPPLRGASESPQLSVIRFRRALGALPVQAQLVDELLRGESEHGAARLRRGHFGDSIVFSLSLCCRLGFAGGDPLGGELLGERGGAGAGLLLAVSGAA